ncbi:uncharacterized protein [Arachis hypogaea]|uniref:uncharacterized protein isoform X1 n=1 Tax=Arachis hypogaea TaxID=3818 RepID=UPI0007AFC796
MAMVRRQRMLECEKENMEKKPFMDIQTETKRFRQTTLDLIFIFSIQQQSLQISNNKKISTKASGIKKRATAQNQLFDFPLTQSQFHIQKSTTGHKRKRRTEVKAVPLTFDDDMDGARRDDSEWRHSGELLQVRENPGRTGTGGRRTPNYERGSRGADSTDGGGTAAERLQGELRVLVG